MLPEIHGMLLAEKRSRIQRTVIKLIHEAFVIYSHCYLQIPHLF